MNEREAWPSRQWGTAQAAADRPVKRWARFFVGVAGLKLATSGQWIQRVKELKSGLDEYIWVEFRGAFGVQ